MRLSSEQIARVRAFNRDYTRRIGVLSRGLYESPYSLTEVRVLYEIAHRPGVTAATLAAELGIDRGYLSRILAGFREKRLLARTPSKADGRQQHLRLTPSGRRELAPLERRSREQVRSMLAPLDGGCAQAALDAMDAIRSAFAERTEAPLTLRTHRAGDMGWVVERHGELYAAEFGWNEQFEALVAGIVGDFIKKLDPPRERCWIAERAGRRLGCVFLVAEDASTARLRLLLVEPDARGLGLGGRLVEECLRFARAAGYRRVVLWTHANLAVARRIYEKAGFRRTGHERRRSFGHNVTSETWELELSAAPAATSRSGNTAKRP